MNERVNAVDIDGEQSQGFGQVYTPRQPWVSVGSFSAASTALGPTARSVAGVSNSRVIFTLGDISCYIIITGKPVASS